MTAEKIRIFLADDHHLVRNGIASLLDNVPGIYLAGEASNGRELVTRYFESRPDVVITDISMPEITGIEAAEKILAGDKNAKILFLSVNDSEEYIHKALEIGALGLINKSISKGDLILAIETVYSGNKYFGGGYPEEELCRILDKYEKKKKSIRVSVGELTPKELEVLKLLCEGMSSQEIAEKMDLSKRTIDHYSSIIMDKFNVSNTSRLVRHVFVNKILG